MKKKNNKDRAKMRRRMSAIVFALTFVFAILTIRLSYIMIVKRADYAARAEEQWTSEVKIDAIRGRILDTNGKELAVSANVYRVDFDLNSIRAYFDLTKLSKDEIEHLKGIGISISADQTKLSTSDIAPLIAKALNLDVAEVQKKLDTKLPSGAAAGSATLVRRIEKEQADKVKELKIHGVIVSPDTKRYYPNNNFLAHVLGSTNIDGKGLTGVELQYNSYLAGVPGMKIAELDKNNRDLPYTISQFTSPVNGKDVTLTIDENIQNFAEKIAQQAYEDNKAKAVSILVMDPKTGEVLAMVNKPDFDPNNPYDGADKFDGANQSDKLQKMWRNRLVNDTFEPGSIFKVITAITGLEENVVNKDTQFVDNGSISVGGITPKCWKPGGHGVQNFPEIIQNSCNVGFVELGQMIGKEKLCTSIDKFGFGKLSGIDLPGEAKGIVKPVNKVSDADLATIAFGQTNTVNSVQYMAAFNAVANGGTLIEPHVMKEVTHTDENDVKIVDDTFKPKTSTVASAEKTAELRSYLERVITGGSGTGTFIEGYHIGGKTGTAQKVINGRYEDGKYISSFVGMAPVSDPKVTVMVTVDEPSNGAYYAAQVAVPYGKPLFTDIFNYLNSKFSDENSNQITRDVVIPEIRGMKLEDAKKALKDAKLDFNIDGAGDTVVSVKPYPGYSVKEGAKINLYTTGDATYNNNVVMPDVRGYSKDDATKLLTSLGITPTFDGTGMVIDQDVAEGEVVTKGTSVKLSLKQDYKD
ncbi:stage V sporulation protein D [Clostridium saccharobutylicum]|uniref:stage V sporulation protein D n=1 Tax=Clostridium saccharobutylicum TaxID=169679 RepID=UPI00040D8960|nr:stage V sporulation protein D [Clostridium saccharobutylicum]AQR91002.1 stage V sporulation protein D [Clostridium saccharobutylicum]AQS00906.1 stage V sporulation protein D [Clostridium saccharobutylicum]AQS10644.1 stage V sporulation protein D [Clostridium saccharobutylicum]AQS14889.1 stage V sporulation protein D [Clostridium saccharobutylicum]MBA2907068.1 stage V sporulation protein D (sporulation-specific penicillin-binding protein) [Clostridium saccharobutylicum]